MYVFRKRSDMKENWLNKRLKELGKRQQDIADYIGVPQSRIAEFGTKWTFQLKHIKKAAEFLGFNESALIDFLNDEISEEELYNHKDLKISEADLQLLNAIKTVAANTQNASQTQNTSKQTQEKER